MSRQLVEWLAVAAGCEQRFDWMAAAAAYGQALALSASDPRLWINQGHALWMADLPHAAERCYRQALRLSPALPTALCGLANSLRDLNRFEEAAVAYASSAGGEARWGRSQVLIGLESYEEAFAEAEARRDLEAWKPFRPGAFWAGGAIDELDPGADLWVWSEQGFGDTFQFLRWIPALADRRERQAGNSASRCGELHLVVEANLVRIIQEGLAWMRCPPRVVAKDTLEFQPLVVHGSLMSLPHALGGAPVPLARPTLASPLWSEAGPCLLPGSLGTGPRVGIVWASGRKQERPFSEREYRKRSLPPAALWQLIDGLQQAGAAVIPLQYGDDGELAAALGFELAAPRLDLGDFAHVARVVAQLDLVISVDTAMAHLIGAMGAPGWILLPWSADPRWLRQREDSPWYPSLRLLRQPAGGDWRGTIDQLLRRFAERSAAAPEHRSSW